MTTKMKKLLSLLLCTAPLLAGHAHAYETSFTLDIDKYYSPYMGANLLFSAWRGYEAVDDIVASGTAGNTSNCMTLVRTGKLAFEVTLANFLMVIQHEVFGHGARAREFNVSNVGYHINVFTGKTTYPYSSFAQLSVNQQAAMSSGGVEATSIFAAQIENSFFRNGEVDSRAAVLYLLNTFDESLYAFSTTSSVMHPDNDANAYLLYVNNWFENSTALSSQKMKNSMIWSWLNPMIYMSGFSLIKYLFMGDNTLNFPTLHIGDARFLPTTRVLFAPYGPEYQLLVNLFTKEDKFVGVNLRYGRTSGKTSWGADLIVAPLANYECFYVENKLSIWHQPHLLQNYAPQNTNKYGFGEFLTLYYKLARGVYALGEVGYKVSGYMPGRQLSRGVYWNVGVRFDVDVTGWK